ncbi:ribosome assembly RNA-binding protein YhbY [Halorhodospira halochloris]|nr:ribosome assembly RNA-binding protein YhbY [Halorhodospira halochloris]MBK1652349.1 RNA-binding protein [Halorhodospira halochloris]MCG5530077.1 ribosome assembly RNA-binding protein YhbY [Halorhodospira halochloris]MCG5548462.1 ribosome assembly RNA-binding protein YhbY [Halorhodospira halochloris]
MDLDQQQLKELRRRGHHLKPVVLTGAAGLSDAVLAEIERALNDHELIKVKLAGADKQSRQEMAERITAQTGAVVAQNIGRVVLLYRENPESS